MKRALSFWCLVFAGLCFIIVLSWIQRSFLWDKSEYQPLPPSFMDKDNVQNKFDISESNEIQKCVWKSEPAELLQDASSSKPEKAVSAVAVSDEFAEEICRKSLEQSFSGRLFERVEIQRRTDAISVILQDAGLPSGADSFTRYHFSLDPMTGSIVDDAVEIIENR